MRDRLKGCVHMGENSLADVLDKDGDDLYGPYWIATTLVVVLFIGGSLTRQLVPHLDSLGGKVRLRAARNGVCLGVLLLGHRAFPGPLSPETSGRRGCQLDPGICCRPLCTKP